MSSSAATDSQYYRIDDLPRNLVAGNRVLGTVLVETFNSALRRSVRAGRA